MGAKRETVLNMICVNIVVPGTTMTKVSNGVLRKSSMISTAQVHCKGRDDVADGVSCNYVGRGKGWRTEKYTG